MGKIIFIVAVVWHFIGFSALHFYEDGSTVYQYEGFVPYLNPVWLWKKYKVNIVGCFFLTILFNLLCPLISVIYWIIKFIGWICTVGRK